MSDRISVRAGSRTLRGRLAAVSFWVGVALPALYLPLLVAGQPGVGRPVAVALVGLHVLALAGGHRYQTGD